MATTAISDEVLSKLRRAQIAIGIQNALHGTSGSTMKQIVDEAGLKWYIEHEEWVEDLLARLQELNAPPSLKK